MLRQVQWIAAEPGVFLTGVDDLVLTGEGAATRLYTAARFGIGTAGLNAFAVAEGGGLTLLNGLTLPTVPQIYGPTGLALVPGWPAGSGLLLAAGGLRSAPAGTVLLQDGQLDKRMTTIPGALAPDLKAVATLELGGTGVVFGLGAAVPGLRAWVVEPPGALAGIAPPEGAPPPAAEGPGANLLAAVRLGGQAVVVAASTAGHRLDSYVALPGGAPVPVQSLGMAAGLGIGAPAAIEIVAQGSSALMVVAGAGSSSLSVLRLTDAGVMVPLFHAIDTLHTRFAAASALAAAEAAGRVYVVAGGGDGGLSLLLLLPSGRLLHLSALAFGAVSPGNVSALAMRAADAGDGALRLDIFAGGQSPGLARLVADLGVLAPPQRAGAVAATLTGGAGNDLLEGGSGAVTLLGGAGDDILIGGAGAAVMTGGEGADIFVPAHNGRITRITDFDPGVDRLDLSGWAGLRDFARIGHVATATGARLTWQGSTIEIVSARAAPLRLADFGPDPLGGLAALAVAVPSLDLAGGPGADRLTGGAGNDTLTGGAGNDTLTGLDGNDFLLGGEGDDLLRPGDGNDTVWAGPGDDRIEAESGNNEVWAGAGNDTVIGGTGNDTLGGGDGDDV
ncbi:MAG: calcium-binding protein, partial [Gemmobacter sp.]